MKPLWPLLCVTLLSPLAVATAQEPPSLPAPALAEPAAGTTFTAVQLEQLLGPIALYPDALIALILPAATASTDVVLAARQVRDRGNDLSQVEHRAWDESVKSLMHYPDILKWMDENLTWTKQVGEAFAEQPAEVMNAIQRLRAQARAAGTLVDTPQQQVLAEQTVIRIVPADPEVIYVPYYDPAVVFVSRPVFYPRPLFSYGPGCRVGSWLAYDFDWHHRTLWVGDRHRRWVGRHDWRRPVVPIVAVSTPTVHVHGSIRPSQPWRPPVRTTRVSSYTRTDYPTVVAPSRAVSPATHPRSVGPTYRGGNNAGSIPRVPPLQRTIVPVQVQDASAIPQAPTVAAAPPVVTQQRLNYRSPTPNAERPTVTRSPSYQRPQAAPPPMPTTNTLQIAPSATRSFPTVTGPQPVNRGLSSRAAPPVPVAPLQRVSPSSQPAATEPSAPASAASSSNAPQPRSQAGPQQRGRRGFD